MVETYGGWGENTCETFTEAHLQEMAMGSASNEVVVMQELFDRLSLVL